MSHFAPLCAAAGPLVLILAGLLLPRPIAAARRVARAATVAALALVVIAGIGIGIVGPESAVLANLGEVGGVPIQLSLRLDALGGLVAALVAGIGALLVGYSCRYLDGDPGQRRFLRRMLETLAAVLTLVLSGNLLLLVIAWVATSLTLHGLLTFYRDRPGAILAARKKFLFSRFGEACLAVAALLLARTFGSLEFAVIFDRAAELRAAGASPAELPWIAGLVVVAALIKCAQFPFHGWLPEVMETPTPVSALLHAGIINAGGFLVLRLSPLLAHEPAALDALLLVGGGTALFAGAVMLTQNSIKVVLAWSTCAQMGFMLMQCGLGAFSTAALHLVAHSLYKAHAFLSASSGVEELRRGGPRAARPTPTVPAVLGALAAAAAASGLVAWAFAVTPGTAPGKFLLGVILSLGVATVLLETRARADFGRIAAWAGGVVLAYFVLSTGMGRVLQGAVAADGTARVSGLLGSALVTGFAVSFFLAARLGAHASRPSWRRAYVFLHAGGYVNAMWDRLVQRLAPLPGGTTFALPAGSAAASPEAAGEPLAPGRIVASTDGALQRIAPLWPLDRFVAVNPFLGYTGRSFEETAVELQRVRGASMTLPRAAYRDLVTSGAITEGDLVAAAGEAPGAPLSVEDLRAALDEPREAPRKASAPSVATVADALDAADGTRWAALATTGISRWCSAYFDRHQASWPMPWQDESFFAAWRAVAALDAGPERAGLAGFRAFVRELPSDPREAIAASLGRIGVADEALDDYLHRAASSVGGWIAYARRLDFEARQRGSTDATALEILAARLAFDAALLELGSPAARDAWSRALAGAPGARAAETSRQLALDLALQSAHEHAHQRGLLALLSAEAAASRASDPARRADAHAVFCIDVRSEVLRRHLEASAAAATTSGFAGFFGLALEYVRQGDEAGAPRCPVLLTSKLRLDEGATPERTEDELRRSRASERRRSSAWNGFRTSPVAGFAFVETLGLAYGRKLLLGGRAGGEASRSGAPSLGGRGDVGIPPEERAGLAASLLAGMSLPRVLPRLVLLAGHGSSSANNAHAAGLDCGACGGQNGAPNARAAAALLNDPDVRRELAASGRALPEDTRFVAGLHDTTTDRVELFDTAPLAGPHGEDLARLASELGEAGRRARLERARGLAFDGLQVSELAGPGAREELVHAAIDDRCCDWSQVRPEWGLAGNAAFFAAPRGRTRDLDLGGRAFLHEYDCERDVDGGVLELILTAPVVVASWINLQYLGSTTENRCLGSGNKVLHNVVGGDLGVILGSGGDLQVGLSLQSIHDGQRHVHEPLRLSLFVEAEEAPIERVLAAHAGVHELVANGWLHLFRIEPGGDRVWRRGRTGEWTPAGSDALGSSHREPGESAARRAMPV